MEDLKRILEALLFASPEPLTVSRVKVLLEGVETEEVMDALAGLKEEYAGDSRAFQLVDIGGGYQLVTKPEYADFVARLVESSRRQKLSKAAMETLAIVVYKQPVVRSTIEGIRGVNVDGVLRTLMERDLIRIVGRADGPGRPLLFGTTKEFLMQFGLNRLSDLPGLREIEELVGAEDGGTSKDAVPADTSATDDDAGDGDGPGDGPDTQESADLPESPSTEGVPQDVESDKT
jgi:segregation and condensation protein B